MRKFIQYFIDHRVITNWIMLVICLAGVFALFNLQRRIQPRYEMNSIDVNLPFPGASAVEVEEGIVIKVEESLRGLEGVEKIYSTSSDGWGNVTVEVSDGYDLDRVIQEVKNIVNGINAYPADAEKPTVVRDTQWNRAIMFSIYGPDDLMATKAIVEEFRDELLNTGKISKTLIWGLPNREISIEISPEDLRRYKLTINDIAQAIRSANLNISSGSVLTEQEEIFIRSYGKKYSAEELKDIEISSSIDGRKIQLSDICKVREDWPDNIVNSEFDGQRSVSFNVMYNNNEDVVEIVQIAEAKAREFENRYSGLIKFDTFIKETDDLQERVDLLTQSGVIGLILVLVALGSFLNVRLAFWVALGIPISFLGMFFVLMILGISINEMSLFGMILVVGILVDDGIIIGESIFTQHERGKRPIQAAIDGTLDVIKPVAISILTTVIAFIPYFYFYGILGDHVWQIAAVVIICLGFSLIEAVIILPAHIAHSRAIRHDPKQPPRYKLRQHLDRYLSWLLNKGYNRLLNVCLEHRWSVMAFTLAMVFLIAGLFMGNHVRSQFFPEIEFPFARVEITMPAGTTAEIMDDVRNEVITKALAFGESKEMEIGLNPITHYSSWYWGNLNVFLTLIPAEERDYSVLEFSNELAEFIGSVPRAENWNVGSGTFGGSPISVRFTSSDYSQLLKAKELLRNELRKIDGVKDIRDDTPLGNNEFIVELKPRSKALGLTLHDVTTQLRQGFYGQEVMRLQRGRDEIKVWVRFPREDRVSLAQVENLKIRTPSGEYIPFKEIATHELQRSMRSIRHENGMRSLQVFANLDYSKNDLAVILKELNSEVVPRILSQVDGVSRSYGGQSEMVQKMTSSMRFTMSIALVAIFTVLMFLLKSYIQTLLIIGLIPMGIIGAVIGHYIMGLPVSILSFLGIVALAGIIINDSVVMMDKYNNYISRGISVRDALHQAGIIRFRPIVLTTLTTSFGLAPLILQQSAQGQFLVPMAVSVAFGLIFGTIITLLMLPATIYCISDLKLLFNHYVSHKIFSRPLLSRRELELSGYSPPPE